MPKDSASIRFHRGVATVVSKIGNTFFRVGIVIVLIAGFVMTFVNLPAMPAASGMLIIFGPIIIGLALMKLAATLGGDMFAKEEDPDSQLKLERQSMALPLFYKVVTGIFLTALITISILGGIPSIFPALAAQLMTGFAPLLCVVVVFIHAALVKRQPVPGLQELQVPLLEATSVASAPRADAAGADKGLYATSVLAANPELKKEAQQPNAPEEQQSLPKSPETEMVSPPAASSDIAGEPQTPSQDSSSFRNP